jgi:hypothetical protein
MGQINQRSMMRLPALIVEPPVDVRCGPDFTMKESRCREEMLQKCY